MDIEIFENAFHSKSSSICRTCYCGKTYYNPDDACCFEVGELEQLKADNNAYPRAYSIETCIFEGNEYCLDCDCWHDRAKKIMKFIDSHKHQIAAYLNESKKANMKKAKSLPEVQIN